MAGLWFSYRAAGLGTVIIVTKKQDTESNTNYAQGGIAAAVDDDDSARLHNEDTLRAGSGIASPEVVETVTEAGPSLVRELFRLGVSFDTFSDAAGKRRFDLGQEGGHRRRRIVHAHDFTGFEIERGLLGLARRQPSVSVRQEHFALDLVLDDGGRCCGALVLDTSSGLIETVRARAVVLAAGGIGQTYRYTTNPRIATGDGIAMGYRAGARVANMEFIQFHPTSLYGHRVDDRVFLISEALRGEGAVLKTTRGRAFMPDYHPDAELAPRDVVARAIASEMERSSEDHVLLDASHLDPKRLLSRFPTIAETCLRFGLDITREPIPVVPAAHYVCGGVQTNSWGETSVPGLFAAGECASSGLHGANRLASNSLLEALVVADRAATRVRELAGGKNGGRVRSTVAEPAGGPGPGNVKGIRRQLQDLMWCHAGIVRRDSGLRQAAERLQDLTAQAGEPWAGSDVAGLELRNLLAVARLVVACASKRPESRGLHFNEDHPEQDSRYAHDTVITRRELEA
jgi:L-aspartate oxidase